MARFADTPMTPAPSEEGVLDALVGECEVYAHQSKFGDSTVTILVNAPAGVTVRLLVNDGDVYEDIVPD